ncbi:MAG: hypothetical protein RLZZ623_3890, partial [Actinomycetota bacterium]
MTHPRTDPLVLIVVPNGTHRAEPLARAVLNVHPSWDVLALWAGDPHLRPVLDRGLSWFERNDLDPEWQRTLVAQAPLHAEWLAAVAACRQVIGNTPRPAILLWAGAIAVLGPLDALVARIAPAIVVGRADGPLPNDGLVPNERDLARLGNCSPHAVGFSIGAPSLLDWLADRIANSGNESIGRILDRAVGAFGLERCADPGIGCGVFRWDEAETHLIDAPAYDPNRPWVLDPERGERGRVTIADHPDRATSLAAAGDQFVGERIPVALPGGMHIDHTIRELAATEGDALPVP